MAAEYNTPHVDVNGSGWGPTALPQQFLNVPYAPFNKGDKLGKAADFVSTYAPRNARFVRDPSGVNAEFQYKHDAVEDATFQLVDTAKGTKPKNTDRLRPTWNQQRFGGRGGSFAARRFGPGSGAPPDANAPGSSSAQLRLKGQQKQNKRWDRLSNARRALTGRRRDDVKIDRTATVKVEASWTILEQFELQQLTKLQANVPSVEDLKWCGALHEYDSAFDRVTSKSNLRVQRYDDRDFYYVTTTDDPVIEELATQNVANVFATDAILAHLMASSRSVFPWDIVVQRVNNMVFFDKRDASAFDLVSVNENASDPPSADDTESINHPDRLSLEATMINQNLSQQMMKPTAGKKSFKDPNPFASDDATPATYAYRYRKFDLGNGLNLVTRCEIHGISHKKAADQYVTAFALNEYDPKLAGGIEWRKKIDSQRGAILANELKNNSCKLARWTAQSLLGGVDEMKIGYVSRAAPKDPYSHVVLGTQSYNPTTFANQIALNQNNMWGVIKMLAELMLEQPEGKYVLMKDPNKPVVFLYSVPQDTFDEDDDEDDE